MKFVCQCCGSTVDNNLVVGWCGECNMPIYNDTDGWYACGCTSRGVPEAKNDPYPEGWEIYPEAIEPKKIKESSDG